ncbi:MAG: hypothetical protein OEW37_03820 [Rhodospirillaceae bacterium]|nr:hypothetical protein [Rhodospirillaceae bacterium]
MSFVNNIKLAAKIAARDMRGGAGGLWLLIAGVIIGTAAVAAVGATTQSLMDGARHGGLESVGGDLSLRLFHRPPSEEELAAIRREGDVSISAELRPMVRAVKNGLVGEKPLLVELKGIDHAYPLYGTVETLPKLNLYQTLSQQGSVYGAVADPTLFSAMGLKLGDSIQIGKTHYQLRATLITEPDRAFRAFTLGPRIMVLSESLGATGAINEGAEVYFYTRVKLPPQANGLVDARGAMSRIENTFPGSGWRMVNAHDGVPGMERTLAMAHVLLLFIGLGVMLVGGAGISGAVRAHVAKKIESIAILKSIGAPPGVVILAIGFEVMTGALVGAFLGTMLGALGSIGVVSTLTDHLPFTLVATPAIKPLVVAGMFGILVTALFAWWPLMGVHQMNARVLLRERITHTPGNHGINVWLGAGVIALALVAMVFWVSPMPILTVGFLFGALVLTAFYYAMGISLVRMAKILSQGKHANVRLALGNLHRTGSPTGPVVMALGLTLTLLVALDAIGTAASRHVQHSLPLSAPDMVAFSLKPETAIQLADRLAASNILERQRIMPFMHARVQAIGGVAVRDLKIPGSINWVIRGDRGVSFAAEPFNNTQAAQPGFSVDAGVAKKLGLIKGDTITLNISGQLRKGPILNFHTVDWTGLDLDFPIIATPVTFKDIAHTFAASLKAIPNEGFALEALIKKDFPDVALIRVADVLRSLAKALDAVVAGLQAAVLLCGLAALIVLVGSVLQGLRERTDEAILFKVLGARRHQLLSQLTIEFLGLGVLVSLVAVPLGLSIAYAVSRAAGLGVGGSDIGMSLGDGILLGVIATIVTLAVGMIATLSAYTVTPAKVLRNRAL